MKTALAMIVMIVVGSGLGWIVSHAFDPIPAAASSAPKPEDLKHTAALRKRDEAIAFCQGLGVVVAMGFNFDVICIKGEQATNLTRFE